VIEVVNYKCVHPAEIYGRIVEVCGEGTNNEGNISKQCRLFEEDRTNMDDEQRSVGAKFSNGKIASLLHTVPNFHQVIISCFTTSRNFVDQLDSQERARRQKTLCRSGQYSVLLYDTCCNFCGNYVENWFNMVANILLGGEIEG
jgi:hypothetical protein